MKTSNIALTQGLLREWSAQGFSSGDGYISTTQRVEAYGSRLRVVLDFFKLGDHQTTIYGYNSTADRNADIDRPVNVGSIVYGETNGPLAFWSGSAWTADAFSVATALRAALSGFASSLIIADGVPIPGPPGTTEFSDLEGLPDTLAGYGIGDAATATQGGKADSAVQPGTLPSVPFTPTGGTETTVQTVLDRAAFSGLSFYSRTVAAARNLTGETAVEIRRYDSGSRLCKAIYYAVGAEPGHDLKFKSADNIWFEIESGSTLSMLTGGAKGDGTTNDRVACQRVLNAAVAFGACVDGASKTYAVDGPVGMSGVKGSLLKNVAFFALAGSLWVSGVYGSMLQIYGVPTYKKHCVENVELYCNHTATNGIYNQNAGPNSYVDGFLVKGPKEAGLWLKGASGDGLNDSGFRNGTILEWEATSDTGSPEYAGVSNYANRTATGIYIEGAADLIFSSAKKTSA